MVGRARHSIARRGAKCQGKGQGAALKVVTSPPASRRYNSRRGISPESRRSSMSRYFRLLFALLLTVSIAWLVGQARTRATVAAQIDPDTDGLPDFQAIHKYRTDPKKK